VAAGHSPNAEHTSGLFARGIDAKDIYLSGVTVFLVGNEMDCVYYRFRTLFHGCLHSNESGLHEVGSRVPGFRICLGDKSGCLWRRSR
jgi:hypothetical protein